MKEIDGLKKTISLYNKQVYDKVTNLTKGIEKTKQKRQEQTGKPYRQQ